MEKATKCQVLEREMLKAADLFQLEGLLQHCVEAFWRGLKVDAAIKQLKWAYNDRPAAHNDRPVGGDRVLCSQLPAHSG